MKKCFIGIVALLYSFISVNMVFADTWTRKADFGGTERALAFSFSIGSKGYIGGGAGAASESLKDFWEYDPAADTWTQKADTFENTARGMAFSIGNKGYAVAMQDDGNKFFEYNPATNTWTQKADYPGLVWGAGFSIGNKGYIGTGGGWDEKSQDFWEYDPTSNLWTKKADFGGTWRYHAVGLSIGNKGYIGGGIPNSGDGPSSARKDFWEYDPTTDIWTQKADIGGVERQLINGFSIGNKGYIYGGNAWSGQDVNYKDFWEYDPAIDTWTKKADFGGEARSSAASFSIGSKGYIGIGITVGDLSSDWIMRKDFWEYAPGSSIFLVPVADKSSLWPPNNKMTPVSITANVSSDGPVTLTAQVSCNEPAKRGTDWTDPVIDQTTGVISLSLRATRAGSGTGRIYTITITATDANGNSATETVTIVVPHDQGK